MISSTCNSTKMETALQPLVVDARESLAKAFKAFDENGDGVVSHDEFRTGVTTLNPQIARETIEGLIDVMDKVPHSPTLFRGDHRAGAAARTLTAATPPANAVNRTATARSIT